MKETNSDYVRKTIDKNVGKYKKNTKQLIYYLILINTLKKANILAIIILTISRFKMEIA